MVIYFHKNLNFSNVGKTNKFTVYDVIIFKVHAIVVESSQLSYM